MDLSLNGGWADKIQGSGAMNQTSPSSTGLSVSDMIKQEEAAEKESEKIKLSDYFNKRSAARKAISSGNITSGNKAQDVMETRIGKLVDLYLDAASKEVDENGKQVFSTEKIIEASKNPSKVINDMKKYYIYHAPDRSWAIDDYIQKGGIASNVYEYLEDVSGKVTNPYGKVEVQGNLFDENTPEVSKGAAAAALFVPSLASNVIGRVQSSDWYKKLDDVLYDKQRKIWDTASDEEYQQYKEGKLPEGNNVNNVNIYGESKKKFYDDYAEALNDGFVGTVDEYKDFQKNVYKATNEAIAERMKEGVLTEDDIESSKWAIGGDAFSEFVTYLALPFNNLFKIRGAAPIINRIANLVVDSTVNTAEIGGMEYLKNRPMDEKDLATTEGVNLFISSLLHSPEAVKYLKEAKDSKAESKLRDLIAKIPDRVKNAYERLSAEQLANIKDVTKKAASSSSIKTANEGIKYFGKQGVDAVNKSFDAYIAAGDKLGKEAQNLKNSGITIGLIEDSLNKELKNLENPEIMGNTAWGEGKAPQIHINKKKNGQWTLNIENEANLNMIKNGEGEGLADAMRKIFEGMFGDVKGQAGAGMEFNEATMLAFMNEVKGATQGTEWSWGNMGAKVFGDGLDAFRNNAELPESFLKSEKEYLNKKDLHNKLSEAFGNYGKYSSDIDKEIKLFEAGKKLQDKNLQGVLELAQNAGYISDTVDAEIIAYGYMLALQDEAAARAFFGNIYPSDPGFIEAVLEGIRNGIREGAIDKYIKSKTIETARKQGVGGMAELTDARRLMNKSVSGGANIAKRRLDEQEQDPYADIDMEAFQEWQRSKK